MAHFHIFLRTLPKFKRSHKLSLGLPDDRQTIGAMEGYVDSWTDEGLDGVTEFFFVFKETENNGSQVRVAKVRSNCTFIVR